MEVCHRDLLRGICGRTCIGALWLFVWEDCGVAPGHSHRAWRTDAAGSRRVAIAYCQAEIKGGLDSRRGTSLPLRLLAALVEAAAS